MKIKFFPKRKLTQKETYSLIIGIKSYFLLTDDDFQLEWGDYDKGDFELIISKSLIEILCEIKAYIFGFLHAIKKSLVDKDRKNYREKRKFTGFKDKNNKKIYLGDGIWLTDLVGLEDENHKFTAKIEFKHGAFGYTFEREFTTLKDFGTDYIEKLNKVK